MALSRQSKEQQLGELKQQLDQSMLSIVSDYRGLSVTEMQDLRSRLKATGGSFRVIKKTLIKKALSASGHPERAELVDLEGQIGLAFGFEDEATIAKVMAGFAKEHPQLEIKSALATNGQLLSADQVKHLATLPGKTELRGQVVGTIAAPLSGLVNVLSGNLRGLVNIFNQLKEQKA